MILIPDFFARTAVFLEGTHPVQQAFLHHLFPESVPFPHATAPGAIKGNNADYPKVALLGFWSLFAPEFAARFRVAFSRYRFRKLESEHYILEDLAALIGISQGLRKHGGPEDHKWWIRQVELWQLAFPEMEEVRQFIRYLTQGGLPPAGRISPTYLVYLVVQEQDWNPQFAEVVRRFYLRTRKLPMPGPDDHFGQTMLNHYGLDACFRRCIWEEDKILTLQQAAVAGVHHRVEARAVRRAKRLVAAAYLLGIPGIALCNIAFFSNLDAFAEWRNLWDVAEDTLLFAGGPFSAALLFVNVLLQLAGRHPLSLKYAGLTRSLAARLTKRHKHRLGLAG
ncbi:MAG: hypothetical protein AAF998_11040 [Bacteroidota bacterium]